jgi:asparagine synthase (glutamine-hydrolysing)
MCGIAGIFSTNPYNVQQPALQKMADTLKHRGPNGEGFFINPSNLIGFAHRRLSIIDLSNAANQPMHYLNRYTIIHNGEIYNYKELKTDLQKQGYTLQSNSDTEVILAAYAQYQEECLQYLDGMFAFAIWDEQEQTLFCARDRFGEKPFYYFIDDEQICFASEIKALWSIGIPKVINHSMLSLFMGLGYTNIPLEPQITFYKNIFSLPPATYFIAKKDSVNNSIIVQQEQYWDLDKVTTSTIKEEEAIEKFAELFYNSIQKRLRSDVAIGSSLSGGLDSSSIAAFLHQLGVSNYQTFSAVFQGFAKDESKYIDKVNNAFAINGNPVQPTQESFIADFNQLITTQEQPFVSSSIYAQFKVFEKAKQHNVTVLLDGQGADESLAGYTKYLHWYLQELFLYDKKRYKIELQLLKNNFPKLAWGFSNKMAAWFPGAATARLQSNAANDLRWKNNLTQDYVNTNFTKLFIHKPLVKKLNDVLYYNTMQFGLEELLRYADKNAMAHGVEVRLPFLQHELVQFIFSLPSSFKIQQGFTKSILRKVVDKKLPTEITWRKEKIGYETPQQDWLTNPFFVEKINAAKNKLMQQGIFEKTILSKKTTSEQDWRALIAAEFL